MKLRIRACSTDSAPSVNGSRQESRNSTTRMSIMNELKLCIRLRDLKQGKAAHAAAVEAGHGSNLYVASTLVDMYARCGRMQEARVVFEGMHRHDVVSWNVLILGYVENGDANEALCSFYRMNREGFVPDAVTFLAVLKACLGLAETETWKLLGEHKLVKSRSLERATTIHKLTVEAGYESNMKLASTLLNLYARCGSMESAYESFNRMEQADVVSWTVLIMGYAGAGEGKQALELFTQMISQGCTPDSFTYLAALRACTSSAEKEDGKLLDGKLVKVWSLEKGMAIHNQIADQAYSSEVRVGSALVNLYSKCGQVEYAYKAFEWMPLHDLVSYTALVMGYAENGEGEKALELFSQIRCRGLVPDSFVLVAALKACSSLAEEEEGTLVGGRMVKVESLSRGMAIHKQAVVESCFSEIKVQNTLLDMYVKCGSMADAQKLFDGMSQRDIISWNVLILGYAEQGKAQRSLDLFFTMASSGPVPNSTTFVAVLKACTCLAEKEEGKHVDGKLVKMASLELGRLVHSMADEAGCSSDIKVASTLIDMYGKCGCMASARKVFEDMEYRNVVSWTALIVGYADNGQGKEALDLFSRMDCEPDTFTYVAVLKACSVLGAWEQGKILHAQICERGFDVNPLVATSLIDFYGKSWSMNHAQEVFDRLPQKGLVQWTALLTGYSTVGDTDQVLKLFDKMQEQHGIRPDSVAFLCVLTACSHSGLVEQGKTLFKAMLTKYKISPGIEHYTCMVDMLGRANLLDEAMDLVKGIPVDLQGVTWRAVLGACYKWKNVELGQVAFNSLLRLDKMDVAAYVLMADIYRSSGMVDEHK